MWSRYSVFSEKGNGFLETPSRGNGFEKSSPFVSGGLFGGAAESFTSFAGSPDFERLFFSLNRKFPRQWPKGIKSIPVEKIIPALLSKAAYEDVKGWNSQLGKGFVAVWLATRKTVGEFGNPELFAFRAD